jgi:hypothetical protein
MKSSSRIFQRIKKETSARENSLYLYARCGAALFEWIADAEKLFYFIELEKGRSAILFVKIVFVVHGIRLEVILLPQLSHAIVSLSDAVCLMSKNLVWILRFDFARC